MGITFQDADLATVPANTVVETISGVGGANRQVIDIGSLSGAGPVGNSSSAIATTATNLPAVTYNYVWNSTNSQWDQLSATSGSLNVGGNVASGVADSGNPVKVGGKYVNAGINLTDGSRGDLQLTANGQLKVQLWNNLNGVVSGSTPSDAQSLGSGNSALVVNNAAGLFNGTNWDRARSNIDTGALITATGATTTQTSALQTNYNGRGIKVVLDMTTVGTGSVTLSIQGKDIASGKFYTILAGAAVVTNSTNVYEVYPGNTNTTNLSANAVLPRTWQVVVTANNANPCTYTVGASVIL